MNLPNKITLARIFMIPVFVVVFYCGLLTRWCYLAAAIIFVLAASTDALDGHIARSRGLVTDLGKFLDPIADKVLVSTAFIVILTILPVTQMVYGGQFWVAMFIMMGVCVALILARELIVSGFRIIAAGRNLVLAADKLGKIKTVLQDLAAVVLLSALAFTNHNDAFKILSIIGDGLLILCTLFTVISGVHYLVKNKKVLQEEKE